MKAVILEKQAISVGDISFDKFHEKWDFTEYEATHPSQITERCIDADAVLCNKTLFTADVIALLPKLKYIGVCATGYNNIDIAAASKHGITVTNVPAYSTDAVAQHVFAFILHLTNRVAVYNQSVHIGDWINSPNFCYFPFPLTELAGKNMGIIGYGSIGKKVAEIAKAFGMNVIVHTRTPQTDSSVRFADLDTVFAEADFLSVHCPLTEQTRKLVNERTLSLMKKTAVVINTARGPIVDENALRDALVSGKITAAAADVIETEPMDPDCPLLTAPNCILTPHVAWAPLQTRERLVGIVYDNLLAFSEGRKLNNVN